MWCKVGGFFIQNGRLFFIFTKAAHTLSLPVSCTLLYRNAKEAFSDKDRRKTTPPIARSKDLWHTNVQHSSFLLFSWQSRMLEILMYSQCLYHFRRGYDD